MRIVGGNLQRGAGINWGDLGKEDLRETSLAADPEAVSMKRKGIICSACSFCLGQEVIKSHSGKFRFIIKKSLSNVRRVKHCHQFFQGLLWSFLLDASRSRNISPDPFPEGPRAFLGSGRWKR